MDATNREEIELLTDRIEDLETHIVELQSLVTSKQTVPKDDSKLGIYVFAIVLPLTVLMIMLMGLSINYQSNKHQISYNSDGLVELGLSGITLLSGLYSLKKHHEQKQSQRDSY